MYVAKWSLPYSAWLGFFMVIVLVLYADMALEIGLLIRTMR